MTHTGPQGEPSLGLWLPLLGTLYLLPVEVDKQVGYRLALLPFIMPPWGRVWLRMKPPQKKAQQGPDF